MSGDIFGGPSWQDGSTGVIWVESRDAAECLQCTRHSPAKDDLAYHVSCTKLRNPALD